MLKENIDGEALLWAHGRLMARREKRRILIVVSDGTPMDEATSAANGFDYLDDHLRFSHRVRWRVPRAARAGRLFVERAVRFEVLERR